MKNYLAYFIDLDGTMYKGKEQIPAASRFISRLQSHHKKVVFVTNNSTRTPEDVAANLANNHDISVDASCVYTTALATADYLDKNAGAHRRVYVIGESGLKTALQNCGFLLTDDHPDYVIVGLDTQVTYQKFETAVLAIRGGATFIGTNADSNLPNERGMVPGAGSLVALVQYATQQRPLMIGKPEKIIMQMALERYGFSVDDVIMVGDNYKTDISAGINVGMDTLLVYTGLSTKKQVAKVKTKPTYEVDTLDDWQIENI
ncbi:TIGR01457 family HAD-type hydrolase [Limosilactobacillus caecicola]|uniref:TIGR01457 family HAD-type hydrolase n=1 Tax=Limosilactobacillus caecicola TaxID=2941332 RepID=UPI00203C7431|nr:TIGR01457 family HAD-type hydrolase [Limosilactobacillus caecicola]